MVKEHECWGLVQSKATVRLDVLGGLEAAPAASHPLYLLNLFTFLILALDTKVHPSLIAAVRRLIRENFGVPLA